MAVLIAKLPDIMQNILFIQSDMRTHSTLAVIVGNHDGLRPDAFQIPDTDDRIVFSPSIRHDRIALRIRCNINVIVPVAVFCQHGIVGNDSLTCFDFNVSDVIAEITMLAILIPGHCHFVSNPGHHRMRAVNRRLIQFDFFAPHAVDFSTDNDIIIDAVIQIIGNKAMPQTIVIKARTIAFHGGIHLFPCYGFTQSSNEGIAETNALTVINNNRMRSVILYRWIEQSFTFVDHLNSPEYPVFVFADTQLPDFVFKFGPGRDNPIIESVHTWPQRQAGAGNLNFVMRMIVDHLRELNHLRVIEIFLPNHKGFVLAVDGDIRILTAALPDIGNLNGRTLEMFHSSSFIHLHIYPHRQAAEYS